MITADKTCSSSLFLVLQRTALIALVAVLAGCATVARPVGVTSSPPPVVGSAPITAYDDYTRAVIPSANEKGKVIVVIVPSSVDTPLVTVATAEPSAHAGSGAAGGAY